MSELKRRSPEEVELWYLGKIASMTVEIMDLKAHAVEVLAEYMTTIYKKTYGEKGYMESCRLEARALLGWEE